MKKQKIAVFITGGTIGMSPSDSGLGVAPAGNFEEILARLAPRQDITVEAVMWADMPSPHMRPEDMLNLAHDIDEKLQQEDVYGVIVLHGTDLLVETAFVLNTVLRSEKPVVITGSMRHLGEAGYDGIRNLQNALIACADMSCGSEVLVEMADWLFSSYDAIKVDSLSVDPFTSQTRGQVGRIIGGRLHLSQSVDKKRKNIFPVSSIDSNVILVTAYPGMDGDFLNILLTTGIQGLVIEGFGAGNIPPRTVPTLKKFIEAGIPVILTSRCIRGGVAAIYDYEGGGAHLLSLGCISAGTLSGTKAFLLLKIALASGLSSSALPALFQNKTL